MHSKELMTDEHEMMRTPAYLLLGDADDWCRWATHASNQRISMQLAQRRLGSAGGRASACFVFSADARLVHLSRVSGVTPLWTLAGSPADLAGPQTDGYRKSGRRCDRITTARRRPAVLLIRTWDLHSDNLTHTVRQRCVADSKSDHSANRRSLTPKDYHS